MWDISWIIEFAKISATVIFYHWAILLQEQQNINESKKYGGTPNPTRKNRNSTNCYITLGFDIYEFHKSKFNRTI